MKQFFTLILGILFSVTANAQRTADLDVDIVVPSSPHATDTMESFEMQISVKNLGPDAVTEADSLIFHMTLNGDTLDFPPQGDYLVYEESIPSGGMVTLIRSYAFSAEFEGTQSDICVSLHPRNAANPVSDGVSSNNTSCLAVEVGEQTTTSVEELNHTTICVWPNPASDFVGIRGYSEIERVQVFSTDGLLICELTAGFDKIDCSTFTNGVYFFQVEGRSGKAIEKVVVRH